MHRPFRRWAWAIPILVAVSSPTTAADPPTPPADLLVVWSDPQRALPQKAYHALVRETEALFRHWGVALVTVAEGVDAGPGRRIRVVLLDEARLGDGGPGVLGQTHSAPTEFPAVWILVPNVRRTLDRAAADAAPRFLARALARVVAHELVHVLAPGLDHAPKGLMRSHLNALDLTLPSVVMDDAFRRALLEAVREGPEGPDAFGRP
jgi:hypothetical protein